MRNPKTFAYLRSYPQQTDFSPFQPFRKHPLPTFPNTIENTTCLFLLALLNSKFWKDKSWIWNPIQLVSIDFQKFISLPRYFLNAPCFFWDGNSSLPFRPDSLNSIWSSIYSDMSTKFALFGSHVICLLIISVQFIFDFW